MSAARYNLIIDQGTDFALEFIVKESGTAKSLSGDTARAQLRPTKDLFHTYRNFHLPRRRRQCYRKNHS